MKKEFYTNNIAPVFNFLGWWATTQTIPWPLEEGSPETVEITRVKNKAGKDVDPLVVSKLCEALGGAVEPPTVAEAEVAQIITMAPDEEPETEETEDGGPFVLDYDNLTEADKGHLKKYGKLQITVTLENLRETVKAPFLASGWQYTGNIYGDGSFNFGAVRNQAGRIVDPWVVKTCLEEMGVLESVDEDEDDTRALHEAVKKASKKDARVFIEAMKSLAPVEEVSEGGGPQLVEAAPPGTPFLPSRIPAPPYFSEEGGPPPGAPLEWSQTTFQMQPGITPELSYEIKQDGGLEVKIDLGGGSVVLIVCSAAQAKKIYGDAVRNMAELKGYWGPETEDEAQTEQEDQSGKEA